MAIPHHPPNSVYMIKELIEMKKFKIATKCCDENEEYYLQKAEEMRELFVKAKAAEMMMPFDELSDDMTRAAVDANIRQVHNKQRHIGTSKS